ncbi:MAG: methyl-accepting chemotaxis protein, partial [Pseudomonadota bacterium]
ATGEISQSVNQAAVGTETVVENIGGVTSATAETAQSAQDVTEAATSVQQETRHLNDVVARFLKDVAAA